MDAKVRTIPILSLIKLSEYDMGHRNLARSIECAGVPVQPVIICDDFNTGFVKAFNRGMQALLYGHDWPGSGPVFTDWEYVCLMPADMYHYQDDWLKRLVAVADSNPLFGFVAPSKRCGTPPQKHSTPGMTPGFEIVKHLAFDGGIIRWEVFDTIGMLNEIYHHYGADGEFVHTAQEEGFLAVWVRDVWARHEWTPDGYPEWVKHDRPLYYSRWTRDGIRLTEEAAREQKAKPKRGGG